MKIFPRPLSGLLLDLEDTDRVRKSIHGRNEGAFFKEEYPKFQGAAGSEADNYSSWSAFADSWNEKVAKLANIEQPEFTYKSASHLQEAFKKLGLRAREAFRLFFHILSPLPNLELITPVQLATSCLFNSLPKQRLQRWPNIKQFDRLESRLIAMDY